jgi:hydroxymethylpyrimidine/phosphomethylpyrimidine kinase
VTFEAVCALAIGGLDPGGGAGVAADLRAIAAAGAFGCLAVAVTTIQSTRGLRSVHVVPASRLEDQVTEVLRHQRVRAIKIGALGNVSNVHAVARILAHTTRIPTVVDTPMLPTRGHARLLTTRAIAVLRREILPRTTLLTVNADEAQTLVRHPVQTHTDARDAALALADAGPQAVLVKGGHLTDIDAVDTLVVGGRAVELRARRLRVRPVHGGGCVLASLIAGRLAMRPDDGVDATTITRAVRWAKRVHHAALVRPWDVGGSLLVLVPGGRQ